MKNSETMLENCESKKADYKVDTLSDHHSNYEEMDAETQSSPYKERRSSKFNSGDYQVTLANLFDELAKGTQFRYLR